jgi:hypothetical protein
MDDLEDLNRIAEKEKIAAQKKQRLDDAYQYVLSLPKGREVLWNILVGAGIYRTTVQPSQNIFYLEGRRSIGLELMHKIEKTDPKAFIKMLAEKAERESSEEAALKKGER